MSDPQITEEIRAAAIAAAKADPEIAAMARRGAGVFHALPAIVDVALRAALAGRTVLDLPEPTSLADESRGRPTTWDAGGDFTVTAKGGSFGARVNIRGGPYLTASAAEVRGAALLAAAREARRLASVSSKGGEPR